MASLVTLQSLELSAGRTTSFDSGESSPDGSAWQQQGDMENCDMSNV